MIRALAFGTACFALVGCVQPSSGVQAQFEAFAGDAATADIMAGICPQYRMRNTLEELTDGFITQMLAAGYSEIEVLQGVEATSDDAVVDAVIARMGREGVTPGDAAALCAYADREVAAGSNIGRFLQ